MKLKKTLMVTPLLLLSINAIAGMGDINGNTKCTIVDSISKKKVIAKSCTYDGAVGGSMSYAISQLNFKLPNGSTYRTVNNATFDFDKNGNVQNLKKSISVNGKAAEIINLHHKTFKKISDKEIESRYEKKSPNFSDVLQCFKYIKKTLLSAYLMNLLAASPNNYSAIMRSLLSTLTTYIYLLEHL